MFCPKCGNELIEFELTVKCVEGEMELSQSLFHRLHETFILKTEHPKDFRFQFQIDEDWFCPGDGQKMIENEGFVECPECVLTLNEFIYELVEKHSHRQKYEI